MIAMIQTRVYPGNKYYMTNRGDGSYDYDCSGGAKALAGDDWRMHGTR